MHWGCHTTGPQIQTTAHTLPPATTTEPCAVASSIPLRKLSRAALVCRGPHRVPAQHRNHERGTMDAQGKTYTPVLKGTFELRTGLERITNRDALICTRKTREGAVVNRLVEQLCGGGWVGENALHRWEHLHTNIELSLSLSLNLSAFLSPLVSLYPWASNVRVHAQGGGSWCSAVQPSQQRRRGRTVPSCPYPHRPSPQWRCCLLHRGTRQSRILAN